MKAGVVPIRCPRVPTLVLFVASPLLCAAQQAQEPPAYGLSGDWGGVRDQWIENGFTLDFSATLELNRVLSGGLNQQTTGHAFYDLTASLDLDRIAGWKDAQFSVEAYVIDGHNPSLDVGDFQYFSDISAIEVAQIAQVFYEQWFGERSWRLKLGKLDANTDFGFPANGTESIHSGTAYDPTIFPIVTYPNPAMGILAGWVPNENWSLQAGMYDGAAVAGIDTGGLGPGTFFGDPPGYFFIGELARRWKFGEKELAGGALLGAWEHTGSFDDLLGNSSRGSSGFYGTLDQELSRTQSAFVQLGFADEDSAPVDRHLGLGFRWTGACSARPDDALGLYYSRVHFGEGAGAGSGSETAYELGYTIRIRPGLALRPDLQWITNPGGDPAIDDALVFSLRCELGF